MTKDNYDIDAEHLSGTNGCVQNCPACIADEERMDREILEVVELMKFDFPEAKDWNMLDDGTVEILNAEDKRIAVITSERLDGYYNHIGG